jgi:hypothetical protein
MQLFLSWSGERSKAIAAAFRDWFPLVVQSVKPWYSPEDIDKGSRWLSDLSTQLEKQSVAIICLTPENLNAPWLLFEAGALSKALDASWVCPVLFDLEPTDYQGPIAQFQATRANKEDIRRLLGNINKRQEVPMAEAQLDTLYEVLWPRLEMQLAAISKMRKASATPHRQTPEILNEVLERIRSIERQISESEFRTEVAMRKFADASSDSTASVDLRGSLDTAMTELAAIEMRMREIDARIKSLPEDDQGSQRRVLAAAYGRQAMERERMTERINAYRGALEYVLDETPSSRRRITIRKRSDA